jgi:hypothetical protein
MPVRQRIALIHWEMAEPHGLAVRESLVREQRDRPGTGPVAIPAKPEQLVRRRRNAREPSRPPLPASTFVTIAKRPLHEAGCEQECW